MTPTRRRTMTSFYERLDERRYRATAQTTGPWSATHQHAGPPSALLGQALANTLLGVLDGGRMVRWTFEILRPVPITELTVTTEVLRPGRSVALGRAVLATDDGPVMTAQGWRIREADVDLPPDRPGPQQDVVVTAIPGPEHGAEGDFFEVPWDEGYHTAVGRSFISGRFRDPGDAVCWLRCRIPLVAGEELTPLQRLLVCADTGNGISGRLDQQRWLYVNTDLTVHVTELPEGEWVGLDATTRFGPHGIGLATARLHGAQGPIGTALQSLLVEPR